MAAIAGHRVDVWTNASCVPIIPFGDDVRCSTARGLFLLNVEIFQPLAALQNALDGFDRVISWYGRGAETAQRRLCELCRNIHFLDPIPPVDCDRHVIDFYCERVEEMIGCSIRSRIPEVLLDHPSGT